MSDKFEHFIGPRNRPEQESSDKVASHESTTDSPRNSPAGITLREKAELKRLGWEESFARTDSESIHAAGEPLSPWVSSPSIADNRTAIPPESPPSSAHSAQPESRASAFPTSPPGPPSDQTGIIVSGHPALITPPQSAAPGDAGSGENKVQGIVPGASQTVAGDTIPSANQDFPSTIPRSSPSKLTSPDTRSGISGNPAPAEPATESNTPIQSSAQTNKISTSPSHESPPFRTVSENSPAPSSSSPAQSGQIRNRDITPGFPPDQSARHQPDAIHGVRLEKRLSGTGVKISPDTTELAAGREETAEQTNITNVSILQTKTNRPIKPVGIDVAIKDTSMPSSTFSVPSESAEAMIETTPVVSSPAGGLKEGSFSLPQEPAAAARQVLGTILKVIDQPAQAEQTKVDLQFSFGKDTLAVRVGMQAGEIHTTFQSSSADLRNTLANQWQGFTEHLPENTRAILDPVFREPNASSSGSPQQQNSHGQPSANRDRQSPFPDPPTFAPGATDEDDPVPTIRQPAAPTGLQLLNTLA